jgi:hypothetical protein
MRLATSGGWSTGRTRRCRRSRARTVPSAPSVNAASTVHSTVVSNDDTSIDMSRQHIDRPHFTATATACLEKVFTHLVNKTRTTSNPSGHAFEADFLTIHWLPIPTSMSTHSARLNLSGCPIDEDRENKERNCLGFPRLCHLRSTMCLVMCGRRYAMR